MSCIVLVILLYTASSHFDGSIFLLTKRADIVEDKLYVARKIDAEKLATKDLQLIQVLLLIPLSGHSLSDKSILYSLVKLKLFTQSLIVLFIY